MAPTNDEVFPKRDLGPAEYWGRVVETRLGGVEKRANVSDQSLSGLNRSSSALREDVAAQIESLAGIIGMLPASDSASTFNGGFGLNGGWTRVNTVTLSVPSGKTNLSILGKGIARVFDTGYSVGTAFAWPFSPDFDVTSEYGARDGGVGSFHEGIDFGRGDAVSGAPIHSIGPGYVEASYYHPNFGNNVVVNHGTFGGNDLKSLYAHMQSPGLPEGTVVDSSTVLGYIGNTGASQGAHLHMETHVCSIGGGIVHNTSNNGGFRTAINPRDFVATYATEGSAANSVSLRARIVINSSVSREFEPFRDLFNPGGLVSHIYPLHSVSVSGTSATVGFDLYVNDSVPGDDRTYSSLSAYGVFS